MSLSDNSLPPALAQGIEALRARWGWAVASGVITLLPGVMIVAHWPASSFFVLGMFLGIGLIFIDTTWITTGLALKRGLPAHP